MEGAVRVGSLSPLLSRRTRLRWCILAASSVNAYVDSRESLLITHAISLTPLWWVPIASDYSNRNLTRTDQLIELSVALDIHSKPNDIHLKFVCDVRSQTKWDLVAIAVFVSTLLSSPLRAFELVSLAHFEAIGKLVRARPFYTPVIDSIQFAPLWRLHSWRWAMVAENRFSKTRSPHWPTLRFA